MPGLWPSLTDCLAKPVTKVSTPKSVNRRGRDEGAGSMRSRVREDKNRRAAGSALSRSNEGFGIVSEALVFVQVRLQPLDDRPDPLPEADAHRLQAVALLRPLQLVEQRGHEPAARAAEGMAEGDGPAVDVDPVHVRVQLALPGQHHGGKRFVDLEEIDLLELEPGFLEHAL